MPDLLVTAAMRIELVKYYSYICSYVLVGESVLLLLYICIVHQKILLLKGLCILRGAVEQQLSDGNLGDSQFFRQFR